MTRAWPFEGVNERRLTAGIAGPREFLAAAGEGTEAVVVRIGANDAQLVLVAPDGSWERWVLHSMEEAQRIAEALSVPIHVGEYPEDVRVRMNARRRPPQDFDARAYPEQGAVGPVLPYPENRPRRAEATGKTADPDAGESQPRE
ncbi:MAG TPA: hypothetical protein VE975_07050 [Actinomycetota bacterium]|nr:hypothetical protein [Actinomycetota bacterium]